MFSEPARRRPLAALACFAGLLLAGCHDRALVGAANVDAAAPDTTSEAPAAATCMLGVAPLAPSTLCGAHPEVCGVACGAACVDLARDGDNCGACGHKCAARAACNGGACGPEPVELVPSSPGCRSMRLAYEAGAITWADLGHGVIKRIATDGSPVVTLATGVRPAAIHLTGALPLVVNNAPVAAQIVVRDGAVMWIGADDDVTIDEGGLAHGGGGTAIWSVRPGQAPTVLLSRALAPGPSPVSTMPPTSGGPPLETPGEKPPISALTLSPDGKTLTFGAGSRLYAMPSAGATTAADVRLVGVTSGPERGFATALATDGQRLFFPASDGTGIHMFDLGGSCPLDAADGGAGDGDAADASADGAVVGAAAMSSYVCPSFVFGSFPIPLLDTITVAGGYLTWAKENNVWHADLSRADPAIDGHAIFSDTIKAFGVTGFAVGKTNAYFGEESLIEKGSFTNVQTGNPPPARVLARGQSWPTSFVVDGARVYWTTTACDIASIADGPQ